MKTPEKIGRYEIIKELGQGGMAVVYLASDPLMGRQVAVKLLPRQLTYDEAMRERFQREARIVASLEHPAIVPVHDFGDFNDQPYLVMRHMIGGSLSQHTKGERQTLPEVVRILTPLSYALDKAHSRYIIHRDLKPDNILFDGDNNPYLSDFGIARLAEGTQTTSIMGTPAYMSPEQITGDVELDGRSDIYALGVILFEMLSGEQPYTADTITQVMMKHVLDPIPRILDVASDLPPMTQVVIERAMAKDREDRYGSAEEMMAAVNELLTASQSAEVEAAIVGTMLQATIVEPPEPEFDPLLTVVEKRVYTADTGAIEREAQAAALYAKLQTAVTAQDWNAALALGAELQQVNPQYRDVDLLMAQAETALAQKPDLPEPGQKESSSSKRPILLIGCGAGILLALCLAAFAVFGYLTADEPDPERTVDADGSVSGSAGIVFEPEESVSPLPTPGLELPTQTPEPLPTLPEPTVEVVEPEPPVILFSDNFDVKSSINNWELWQDENAEFAIGGGKLIATGRDPETLNWVKQVDSYTDFEVTVKADILEGGSAAIFGALYYTEDDNYVGCFIHGDNSAYCGESLGGDTIFSDWVVADLSAFQENDILFVVSGEEWAMAVNGKCVGSGLLDFEPGGQPALAVSTIDQEIVSSIAYEDYVIRQPTAEGLAILQCEVEYFE